MLGDNFFDTSIFIIVALWVAGLMLLFSLTFIKKFFPKFEQSIDYILFRSGKVFLNTMKLSLLVTIILLVVWWITGE